MFSFGLVLRGLLWWAVGGYSISVFVWNLVVVIVKWGIMFVLCCLSWWLFRDGSRFLLVLGGGLCVFFGGLFLDFRELVF